MAKNWLDPYIENKADENVKNDTKSNVGEADVKNNTSGVSITPGNPAAGWNKNTLGTNEVKTPKWDADANYGIRNSFENEFAGSGELSYKDGKVFLNGKYLVDADNNVDGTTYVKNRDEMVGALSKYAQDNEIVAARDYVTSSGVPVDIGWDSDSGTVLVNGVGVKPEYVIDGKAYVKKSTLDDMLSKSSLKTNEQVLSEVNKEYGDEINARYNKLMNTSEFSYNPDNDPMYQAYIAMQKKAITDAYNENVASARFRTGGVPSAAAMQQAEALRASAVDDIAARQADFEQMAYQRYNDGIERDYNNYLVAKNLRDSALAERLSANSADKSDWYAGKEFDFNQLMNEIALDSAVRENYLDSIYLPGMYEIEYNDAKRQDEVGEKYTLPLAELGYQNQILQNDSLAAGIAGQKAQTSATQASTASRQQDMKINALGAAQTMLSLKGMGYSEEEINALMAYYL